MRYLIALAVCLSLVLGSIYAQGPQHQVLISQKIAAGAPSLPTTDLTFNLDASDTTNIWTTWSATTPYHSGVPANGNAIQTSEDDNGKDIAARYSTTTGESPVWVSTTPLMALPNLSFENGDELDIRVKTTGALKALSSLITASAFTIILSIRVDAVDTTSAISYENDCIICDSGQNWGIHLRNDSSVYKLRMYQWDTNEDFAEVTISLNTNYVVMVRHDSGSIYISLDGGSETSVLSATTLVAADVQIGHVSSSGGMYFDGRIGQMLIYNVASKADALTYMLDRW